MTEKRMLHISFLDSEGKQTSLSIEDPRDTVNFETVRTAAENILAQGIMESASGVLASFKGAKIITTRTEVLA